MLQIRQAQQRGHFDHGWLNTFHTFSFGNYYDPQHMGFRSLRVINEDRVRPSRGFGRHGHRDMEILTYVLEGVLEHQDSLGHVEQLHAGEVQRMTAGSGIQHSEYNPSTSETVHLYQIWIEPRERGLPPEYEQRRFDPAGRRGSWQLIASPAENNESMVIQQNVNVYLGDLPSGELMHYELAGRDAWLQVMAGSIVVQQHHLNAGDAIAVRDEQKLALSSEADAKVMLFEFAQQ